MNLSVNIELEGNSYFAPGLLVQLLRTKQQVNKAVYLERTSTETLLRRREEEGIQTDRAAGLDVHLMFPNGWIEGRANVRASTRISERSSPPS